MPAAASLLRLGARLRALTRWRDRLDDARRVGELGRYWSEGGLTISYRFDRGEGEAVAALLVQPDGDLIASVPRGFGDHPADAAAVGELMKRARSELDAVARNGFEAGVRSAEWAADVAIVLAAVATAGAMLAQAIPWTSLLLPFALAAARVVGGRGLRRIAAFLISRRLRAAR